VAVKVKDFQKLEGWTVARHNEVHSAELEWLWAEVLALQARSDNEGERPVLAVIHHAPCVEYTSSPEDASNAWTSAFATDLIIEGDYSCRTVTSWVFGHTHFTSALMRNGISVVSNQRGYVLQGTRSTREKKSFEVSFDAERVLHLF
jgi:hypothetical protein